MAHGKKSKTEGQKKLQKARTYNNLAKKYSSLIATKPDSPHKTVWEKKLEFYSKVTA